MKLSANILLAVFLFSSVLVYAGDLEPSAAPASTMKTLDQVEPRIPIPGSDTVVGVYSISQSGSYYLTGDRYSSTSGIYVGADNVTIDLMGYTLTGSVSGGDYGIVISTGYSNVEISNGTITNFTTGIYAGSYAGQNHRVIKVRVCNNAAAGINLNGSSCLVKDCSSVGNGGSSGNWTYGIRTGSGSVIEGNTVNNNGANNSTHVYGIMAAQSCTIRGNTVYNNAASANGNCFGIYGDAACIIKDNAVFENGNSVAGGCYGMYANTGSTVINNSIRDNGQSAGGAVYGINAASYGTVSGNTVYGNGTSATGTVVYGLYLYQGGTVTNNSVCGNGVSATSATIYGIITSLDCFVDQNTAVGNGGTNLYPSVSCTFGTNHAP